MAQGVRSKAAAECSDAGEIRRTSAPGVVGYDC